jgi:hypothetical protein
MNLVDGISGLAYAINDLFALIALVCSMCIGVIAVINLVYYKTMDASWEIYFAFLATTGFGILGQATLFLTGKYPITMGIFGLPPRITNFTLVCAVALFLISMYLRVQKQY